MKEPSHNSRRGIAPRILDEEERDDALDDAILRARVRQRIQQRVQELQSKEATQLTVAPFMVSLHQDVVQTAAQILGKFLARPHEHEEPLELTLVHRLLVKEVELQALQQQRQTTQ